MVQKERRRTDLQTASVVRSDQAHVVYHARHAMLLPCQSRKGVMTLTQAVSNHSVKRRLMPLARQERF
jgi:hypothetical protein